MPPKKKKTRTRKKTEPLAAQAVACTRPFKFLGLPLEMRRLIYGYLIPNAEFVPANDIRPKELRRDGRQCTPGILAVNRQLHDEVKVEWYSTTPYEVKLDSVGVDLLGSRVVDETPDDRMGWIRDMRLVVRLKPYSPTEDPELSSSEVSRVYNPVMESLVRHLLSFTALRLRYVDLVVTMTFETYMEHLGEEDKDILEALKHNFDAGFRKLRGVAVLRSWKFDYSEPLDGWCPVPDGHPRDSGIKENAEQFEKVAIPYFEQLAMTINPPETKVTYLGKIRDKNLKVEAPWMQEVMEMMDPYW
jgi:hypothetical protein